MTKPSSLSRTAELALIAALLLGIVIVFQWVKGNQAPGAPVELVLSAYPPPATPILETPMLSPYPPPATPILVTPAPTTPPLPTPTPTKLFAQIPQMVLAYIAQRDGIPVDSLVIEMSYHLEYPSQSRMVQVMVLRDLRPGGKFYHLWVDLASGNMIEEDISLEAKKGDYGKLDQRLYEQLKTKGASDISSLKIVTVGGMDLYVSLLEARALAEVSAKYPEAKAAVEAGRYPMDVANQALSRQIAEDYYTAIVTAYVPWVEPFVVAQRGIRNRLHGKLIAQGIIGSEGSLLTESQILLIAQQDEVKMIYLTERLPYFPF